MKSLTRKIYFIVATIEGREKELINLLESIETSFSKTDYRAIIVRQFSGEPFEIKNKNWTFHNITKYGASHARNYGIKTVATQATNFDYICFPDDDCYYHHAAGELLERHISQGKELIFGDIRDPEDRFRMGCRVLSKSNLAINYCSINCPSFFVKLSRIKGIFFNENFGPGARYPAVEETEFLLRLATQEKTLSTFYEPKIKVFHPHETISGKKLYDYSYAQGVFFRKTIKLRSLHFWSYLIVISRPFAGLLKNISNRERRSFYLCRIKAIKDGFFESAHTLPPQR